MAGHLGDNASNSHLTRLCDPDPKPWPEVLRPLSKLFPASLPVRWAATPSPGVSSPWRRPAVRGHAWFPRRGNAGHILGFIVFLVAFLWAFAARSVARVWLVLAGGGALMAGAAWLLQRALL
jgi:hypothetical protein